MILLAAAGALLSSAQPNGTVVEPVMSTVETAAGQPIMLPSGPVEVRVSTYVIAPGARLPVHKHPAPRYGYMLDGALSVTITETGKRSSYKKGDFIVEAVDRWHSAENQGNVPARLLVIDQAPKGTKNVIAHTDEGLSQAKSRPRSN